MPENKHLFLFRQVEKVSVQLWPFLIIYAKLYVLGCHSKSVNILSKNMLCIWLGYGLYDCVAWFNGYNKSNSEHYGPSAFTQHLVHNILYSHGRIRCKSHVQGRCTIYRTIVYISGDRNILFLPIWAVTQLHNVFTTITN